MPSSAPSTAPQVKLVIWDLDESLWAGVLSEGSVQLLPGRAALLSGLVDRGVMVSVSSRNDEDAARAELEDLGLWDLVVMPRINWEPKGSQIRDLIAAMQLRPANVLFVDDNHLNREEAAFFAPGLQVVDPAEPAFEERMKQVLAGGKDDPARRRLAEYRLLESKAREAAAFEDNRAFLRSCDIVAEVVEHPQDVDRIAELIARTNQLNYRKVRIDARGVGALLEDPRVRAVAIRVRDRFGDYGLVGFAAVRDGKVEQLAFSCRILGMGVERAVYEYLGSPAVEVAEPVSAPLTGDPVDWVAVVDGAGGAAPVEAIADPDARAAGARTGVLFVGGCDLESTVALLDRRVGVTTHFNYSPADRPKVVIHRDSIDYLLSDEWPAGARDAVLADAPFLDDRAFQGPAWTEHEHIVYSPLIDYVQAKYTRADLPGVYVSYGDVLQPTIDDARIARLGTFGLDEQAMRRFAQRWTPAAKPDGEWEAQLRRLFARMRHARSVVVLLGATSTFEGLDEERVAHHLACNALVSAVAAEFANVEVLPVDQHLHARADFTNSLRHYSRRVYADIAADISGRLPLHLAPVQPGPVVPGPRPLWRRAIGRIRRAVGR